MSIPFDESVSPEGGDVSVPIQYKDFPLSFTGDTGEFFRIWIVNLFLTLVTLGFYTPWARVRTRRYFHAHTYLDGHSFDYLAKPINILWGYCIVLFVVGGYYVAGFFNPVFTVPFILLYVAFGPWVVYKAMRFKAHNTSYRNVRFQFHGTVGEAYKIYLGMALLIPLTLGLITPYWIMKQREYFYRNLSFGGKRFGFNPDAGEYYTRYILGGVFGMLFAFVFGLIFFLVISAFSAVFQGQLTEEDSAIFYVFLVLGYIPTIAAVMFVQIYVYVTLLNHNLSRLQVDTVVFRSKLALGKYFWISFTNVVATVASLGLAAPWAKIRKTRYLAESVSLNQQGESLGEFVAGSSEDVSAIGDAAADVFEFDIGW